MTIRELMEYLEGMISRNQSEAFLQQLLTKAIALERVLGRTGRDGDAA